jgi:hypothetical protein
MDRSPSGIILALLISFLVILFVFCVGGAFAHEAPPSKMQPLGWQYGWDCCSMMDCRPLASNAVAETPQGYVIRLTGEVIPYGDKRLKQSKDEFYHQCTIGGDPKAVHSICLYKPDRGF